MSEIRVMAELNLAQWYFCLKEKHRMEKRCTHKWFLDCMKDKLIRLKSSISIYI